MTRFRSLLPSMKVTAVAAATATTLLRMPYILSSTSCAAAAAASSTTTVIRSANDLPYDENSKLATHVLLYPAVGKCSGLMSRHWDAAGMPHGYTIGAVEGDGAIAEFFPPLDTDTDMAMATVPSDPSSVDDCPALCQERGVDRSLVSAVMPHRRHRTVATADDKDSKDSLADWFQSQCTRVEVGFMNYHSSHAPLKMYWVHPHTGHESSHGDLLYGERNTRCFDSFLGHVFRFRDGDTGALVAEHTVEFVTMRGIGRGVGPYATGGRDFDFEIRRTHLMEWARHDRIKRTFSSLGFKKGRLPDDVFASVGAFYYNNRNYKEKEEWSGKGVFVNWWEVDVYFIQIPWGLKTMWQGRLLDLVEEWTGVELEQTDMYGLRQYEEGARLLTHVDREATHAASLIVNVAQGNLTKPWPVEVYDHANRLHEVPMTPGDVVYYESARCLHGRNRPLEGPGAYYVNLFTHYRPKGDSRWYEKPNPAGTPEPLLDAGECRLVHDGIKDVDARDMDTFGVGAVRCDDDAVGPNVSPTLYSAAGGEGLQTWWEMVSPVTKEEEGIKTSASMGGDEL